jgi:hypothetical protein
VSSVVSACLRPNSYFDRVRLKRKVIEHRKIYQMTSSQVNFVNYKRVNFNWIAKLFALLWNLLTLICKYDDSERLYSLLWSLKNSWVVEGSSLLFFLIHCSLSVTAFRVWAVNDTWSSIPLECCASPSLCLQGGWADADKSFTEDLWLGTKEREPIPGSLASRDPSVRCWLPYWSSKAQWMNGMFFMSGENVQLWSFVSTEMGNSGEIRWKFN